MGSPVNNSRTVMVGDNLNSAIASTAIEEMIQDASPQLGADLDCNGYDIQFDDGTGIEDDSGNKALIFGKTTSATTYAKITNNATGTTGPLLSSAGETNVDLRLSAAGTGDVKVTTGGLRVTSDNEAISVGAGNDLALSHDGSNSTITGGVGKITVTPAAGSVLELDNSNCTVDNGSVQIAGDLDVDNISINGNTVSSTSGDLQLKAVSGSSITFQDDADDTKQLTLDFATIGSSTERTWTFPNSDGTLVGKDTTDTLTNKTLTAPVLNDPTFDVAVGVTAHTGSAQGNGAITSTFVEIATVGTTGDAVTLPAAAAGKIVIIANNGANSADVFPASGDKIDGGSANAALALAAGSNRIHICQDATDWDTIEGNVAGTFTASSTDTLTNKSITGPIITGSASAAGVVLFKEDTDNGTNSCTLSGPQATADVTVTLPAATDTLVGKATTDTLTNKTLTAPAVTNLTGTFNAPTGTIGAITAITLSGSMAMNGTPGSDHTANGPQTNTFAAGYTTTLMDLVYMGSGSKWLEADSDATGTSINLLGIALEVGDDTDAINVALPGSFVRDDSWSWTPGVPLYVSGTLGAITATKPTGSGDIVRTVGFAVHADYIYFNPSPDYITLA